MDSNISGLFDKDVKVLKLKESCRLKDKEDKLDPTVDKLSDKDDKSFLCSSILES